MRAAAPPAGGSEGREPSIMRRGGLGGRQPPRGERNEVHTFVRGRRPGAIPIDSQPDYIGVLRRTNTFLKTWESSAESRRVQFE
jgi:hypothetical protein